MYALKYKVGENILSESNIFIYLDSYADYVSPISGLQAFY